MAVRLSVHYQLTVGLLRLFIVGLLSVVYQYVLLGFFLFLSVEFKDLWKFHAPVRRVEGFDVTVFDKLIEVSSII